MINYIKTMNKERGLKVLLLSSTIILLIQWNRNYG